MMELRHKRLGGFRPVFNGLIRQEETLESIVPDALPDISQIIHTSGVVLLRQREAASGSARIMGTVRTTVMYQPEGEAAPCCLTLNIPFLCSCDHPSIRETCRVIVNANVISADAQTLNPRKVLARVELVATVTIYEEDDSEVCVEVSGESPRGLQTLLEAHKDFVVTDVVEKAFTFSDVLRLPPSKPAVGSFLSLRTGLSHAEARTIGKKLVAKGEVTLTVRYICEGGITSAKFDLPYSQVMEIYGEGEESSVQVEPVLTGLNCEMRTDGEFEVNFEILLQAAVRREREVSVLADLYSICECLRAERGKVKLTEQESQGNRRQLVRQLCPCSVPAKLVADCALEIGEISQLLAGEGAAMLTAKCYLDALCIGEDDHCFTVSYAIPAALELPVPAECQCICRCCLMGEVSAVPVAGGLEVRFEVEFSYMTVTHREISFVTSVRQEQMEQNPVERPSIVVRMVGTGERLWDIAKCCGSTVEDIQAANVLTGGEAPVGTLLLIPKSR